MCKTVSMLQHVNKIKAKKTNNLNKHQKSIWQSSTSIHKTPNKIEPASHNKDIYEKPTTNISIRGEKW